MTAHHDNAARSGRRSDRVTPVHLMAAGPEVADRLKGPESMAALVVMPSTPERVRGHAVPGRRRVGQQRRDQIEAELSSRDLSVLTAVSEHRFLTTLQLQRLHFSGNAHASEGSAARICRRVLKRLHQLRIIEHLDRRVGGLRAGSASYVWRVGPVGDALLRAADDGRQARARRKEPSLRHLEHCLAVADVHLALRDLPRHSDIELLRVELEPACWRTYLGLHGNREVLKPDLAAVTVAGDFEDHWFIEVDRATESLPTLLGKCDQYQQYRHSGDYQAAHNVFPVVVWLVPDDHRAERLRSALTSSRHLDPSLHRICTPATFLGVITGGAA